MRRCEFAYVDVLAGKPSLEILENGEVCEGGKGGVVRDSISIGFEFWNDVMDRNVLKKEDEKRLTRTGMVR